VRISRIRLSDRLHLEAHDGRLPRSARSRTTPSSPKMIASAKHLVPCERDPVTFRLRLEIELLPKVPDAIRRFKAHRQSPSAVLAFLRSAPEVRPLSSTGITRLHRSYEPVRLPISPPPEWWRSGWQPPRDRASPDVSCCLINVPCPLPRRIRTGAHVRFPSPSDAAFPVAQAGRHPHRYFRGLLRLHSRYGPLTRSAAQGDLCHRASAHRLRG
jgi:hypothetical protein